MQLVGKPRRTSINSSANLLLVKASPNWKYQYGLYPQTVNSSAGRYSFAVDGRKWKKQYLHAVLENSSCAAHTKLVCIAKSPAFRRPASYSSCEVGYLQPASEFAAVSIGHHNNMLAVPRTSTESFGFYRQPFSWCGSHTRDDHWLDEINPQFPARRWFQSHKYKVPAVLHETRPATVSLCHERQAF